MTIPSDDKAAVEVSSPACSMPEADDAYMGYAAKDELTALLNELLEAEHAGARVTLESAPAACSSPIAELMLRIQRDEARWCAMLADHVRLLGESPTPTVGAFYGKAMAIVDLGERIAFLNRGQAWVVRKLRELLPRVRSDQLHADLAEMLRSHEANIALATNFLSTGRDVSSDRIARRSNRRALGRYSQFQRSATWMRPRSRPGVGRSACA